MKLSLSVAFTHWRPDPAVTDTAVLLLPVIVTDVLKRPDGLIVLLLLVFFTAEYPSGVKSCFLVPSFNSGRVLIILPFITPLASVVEPIRVTVKTKLLVTAVTVAL